MASHLARHLQFHKLEERLQATSHMLMNALRICKSMEHKVAQHQPPISSLLKSRLAYILGISSVKGQRESHPQLLNWVLVFEDIF